MRETKQDAKKDEKDRVICDQGGLCMDKLRDSVPHGVGYATIQLDATISKVLGAMEHNTFDSGKKQRTKC